VVVVDVAGAGVHAGAVVVVVDVAGAAGAIRGVESRAAARLVGADPAVGAFREAEPRVVARSAGAELVAVPAGLLPGIGLLLAVTCKALVPPVRPAARPQPNKCKPGNKRAMP
jgi:hypothetical protein